jgi:hypothetical protein
MIIKLQELIKVFLRNHSKFIESRTGIVYFTEEDIKEMDSWNGDDIEIFFKALNRHEIISHHDMLLSPWCTVVNCRYCGYGRRHGMCCETNSSTFNTTMNILIATETLDECGRLRNMDEIINLIEYVCSSYESILCKDKFDKTFK